MEHHAVDLDYWEDLVAGIDKPIVEDGFATVTDTPGLGIELNEDVVKQYLDPEDDSYFRPTPEWNEIRSWDRLWS